MKCRPIRKTKLRTNTLWLSDDWEGLSHHELKRRLLEKMENSVVAQEKFWSKVKRAGPDECWEWIGARNEASYGHYTITATPSQQVGILSHRIAFLLSKGPFPEEAHICHHCDNPPCCNPKHLFLGDAQLNNWDKVKKDRQNKGETSPSHKLKDYQVIKIRTDYATGTTSLSILAREYGMGVATIHAIIQGRTWKHLL